jgi:hypothetical protein
MEANVPIDDARFHMPTATAAVMPGEKPADASETLPKNKNEKKPPAKPTTKP